MSESQTKRLRSRPGTISAILVIAILGCGLDLAAKEAAFQHHFTVQGVYGAGQPLQILETGLATFSLVREHNTGMAFGVSERGASGKASKRNSYLHGPPRQPACAGAGCWLARLGVHDCA